LTALITWDLSGTKVSNPAPLIQSTALTMLFRRGTPVTDFAPLSPLTTMTTLDLRNTQVRDPRPLISLTKLATEAAMTGLIFADTPFAALPEFVGIAEIEDTAERAQRMFAALEGWVTAGEVAVAPKPDKDDLLPVLLTDGQFEQVGSRVGFHPTAAFTGPYPQTFPPG
jgi:hypothetical protein